MKEEKGLREKIRREFLARIGSIGGRNRWKNATEAQKKANTAAATAARRAKKEAE